MTSTISTDGRTTATGWIAVARELGPVFASRAAALDANDSFAAENFRDLKERRVFSAGVPAELGGGGATLTELCGVLRELGRHCGGTALALSMHTHIVGSQVWMYRKGMPMAPMLQRTAAEDLFFSTSNAYDWLDSSGTAEKVDGGFRVSVRKHFASGSPAADIFLASAIYDDPEAGPTIINFPVATRAEGVTVMDNWRTLGMRASGSNDVVLDGVFVPDEAIGGRRPKGSWPEMLNVAAPIALPVIYSVYLGVAEGARDLALQQAAKKRDNPELYYIVGEMENALAVGQMAVQWVVDAAKDYEFEPSLALTNACLMRKTIASESLTLAVQKAMEVVGGSAMFRSLGLERYFRDIQAAQFHPLQPKRQHKFTGRFTLGLHPIE